jgi:xanthine dehydrogenase accessory factor
MTHDWLQMVLAAARRGPMVRAVVVSCAGSCPREVGADMLVWADRAEGTIGGGALEHDVIAASRTMIAAPATKWQREVRAYHLGPDLNQCCGGAVSILLERFGPEESRDIEGLMAQPNLAAVVRPLVTGAPMRRASESQPKLSSQAADDAEFSEPLMTPRTPLFIYGAGHVARALVRVLEGLPFQVTWIDIERTRFPRDIPASVAILVHDEPQSVVGQAPSSAFHLVMTHSHELDEAIVAAILQRGAFNYLGLIGSATKAARFRQRLLRVGIGAELVDRISAPIGLQGLSGKAPAVIAVSVAADLLMRRSNAG